MTQNLGGWVFKVVMSLIDKDFKREKGNDEIQV